MIDAARNVDPLQNLACVIRNDAAFNVAARHYATELVAWRRKLGLFNRAGTSVLFHITNYAVYLHLAAQAGQIEHGATFSRLLAICEARGNCGSRALRTILAGLTFFGLLRKTRATDDKRVSVYVPADTLLQQARTYYGISLSALDALLGDTQYGASMSSDPTFFASNMARIGRAVIEDGVVITEAFPELHDIIGQAGGLPTCFSIADAQMRGYGAPAAKAIARDFSLSASQVRQVMAQLASRGLIVRNSNGEIVDATLLVDQHLGLLAREIALHVKYGLDAEARFMRLDPAGQQPSTGSCASAPQLEN